MAETKTIKHFWDKIEKQANGCWDWLAGTRDGYGYFWNGSYMTNAHRFSYELLRGSIPAKMTIDHLCRNRVCVNPSHMEIVTIKENVLRGVGLTARYAKATHCLNGHPFDKSNTYITPRGHRDCRVCRREASLRYMNRQRRIL